ncbi:hypothetical protein [Parafrankia sp. FMc2]
MCLAFQSQAWHTDDTTGHTLPGIPLADLTAVPPPANPTVRSA